MSIAKTKLTGWLKDYSDFRYNTPATNTLSTKQKSRGAKEPVSKILGKLNSPSAKKTAAAKKAAITTKVDLCRWCSPIGDQ